MIKRIVEVSHAGTHLSISLGQLILKQNGGQVASIPCDDIGVLIVDHQPTSYTHSVFSELLKNGAAVVLSNGTHHPVGMFLPLRSNTLQNERFRDQVQAKEPLKKGLWQQIVRAKIAHQAKVVPHNETAHRMLLTLRDSVRSGDSTNIEARASRIFWHAYAEGTNFRRDINGPPPNNLLNYGYMVMRAAVARAICGAGLLPTLGIHHHNRYNAYCLADDMAEPFRGFVEKKVRDLCAGMSEVPYLSQAVKASLLTILYDAVEIAGFKGPLMVGLHRTMASLQRCFAGKQKKLNLPKL